MSYKVLYYMNIGRRDNQEDCIFVNGNIFQKEKIEGYPVETIKGDKALFAVCDGMGGHSKGELASRFVCERLMSSKGNSDFSKDHFQSLLQGIQDDMHTEEMRNSGTTLACVALNGTNAIILNAGDSRVYKIRDETIDYLSHDHSLVQNYLDKGLLLPEEAFDHPHKNVIAFGLGDVFSNDWGIDDKKIYIKDDMLKKDEYYFLCTDGVNDILRDNEIFSLLHDNPFENFQDFVECLKERMNDNFSFILIGKS